MKLFNEMIMDLNSLFPRKDLVGLYSIPKLIGYYYVNRTSGYIMVSLGFTNMYSKTMEVCKTDVQNLIRLLDSCAGLIDKHCNKPCDLDKARQCRKMSKKLKKKQ